MHACHLFCLTLQLCILKELEVKLDNLNDEYVKMEGIKQKMEDELKEKQRKIESQELVRTNTMNIILVSRRRDPF